MQSHRALAIILLSCLLSLSAGLMAQAPAPSIVGTWRETSVMQVLTYADRSAADTTVTLPKENTVTFTADMRVHSVTASGSSDGSYYMEDGWLGQTADGSNARSGAKVMTLTDHSLVLYTKGRKTNPALVTETTLTFVR